VTAPGPSGVAQGERAWDRTGTERPESEQTSGFVIEPGRSYGFFTDTTLCIGCKACEVACKQWNGLPADGFALSAQSYDNTRQLSATTWRHVAFIEQFDPGRFELPSPDGVREQWAEPGQRWLLMSDVCKHCVNAPCLEACPTGSIVRTEFDSVFVQQDICNGCGYCVPACPFGVVQVDRERDGKAHKCTLCYDRLRDGLEPACAKSCPTDSIQFGPVDELLERAKVRAVELRGRGIPAYLYGSDGVMEDHADTTALDGLNCFFLLIDKPEVYNLPPAPRRPSSNTGRGLLTSGLAAAGLIAAAFVAFRSRR
jgi:formate dehydrogenase iron-sulfur subunit